MKKIILLLIVSNSFFITAWATNLNGRISILNNDGSNYKILLQINTDSESKKLGGSTMVIGYDTSMLSFSDNPERNLDYIFSNFDMGYYDTATVTKIKDGQIWINIDLLSDRRGTLVQTGPDMWTDMVLLNFSSDETVPDNALNWSINSKYWHVYDSDNETTWEKGNFDEITYLRINTDENLKTFNLSQNYPNPFNPTTSIEFTVPSNQHVTINVYNIIGELVRVLANDDYMAGSYKVEFDGAGLPSGVYIYRLQSLSFTDNKKMILLK